MIFFALPTLWADEDPLFFCAEHGKEPAFYLSLTLA